MLSDEGRIQRRDLAMTKQELSKLDLFDDEAYEEIKIQKDRYSKSREGLS